MYPVKYGVKKTILMMNVYTALMFVSVNLLFFLNLSGWFFFLTSNILNGIFIFKLYQLNISKNLKKDSIKLFGYSIIYLFLIFLFAVIDKYI